MHKKLKGLILYPKRYEVYLADRENILFQMIAKKFGFKIEYGRTTQVPPDTDIVIAVMQRTYQPQVENHQMFLSVTPKKIKMIGYLGDLGSFDNVPGRDIEMLNRYDIILSRYKSMFQKKYPQFLSKTLYFPNFFAPEDRYTSLSYNTNPIYKALIAGRLFEKKGYPLRIFIANNLNPKRMVIMPHPKFMTRAIGNKFYTGDRYAKRLNEFFACPTCAGRGCLLTKYLEIPAAGSLLIANEIPDSKTAGFIAGKHFVAINKKNAIKKINHCLDNPGEYESIRKEGMKMVRANHSVTNRYNQLVKIIEGI